MKKFIYIITTLLVFTSCNKFLDVKPESEIDKTELFTTEAGFKEALNGVYTLCASATLYGESLTFGNLDIMAQNYDFTDIGYRKIASFDYSYPDMVSWSYNTWVTQYRAIANCNNILENIDAKKSLFNGDNYELIKGEALTLRAYLHFDLLRLYAPSYKSNPTAKAIPYVTTVSTKSTKFSTVTEVLNKAIDDLNAAKILLKTADPINNGYTVGYPDDAGNPEVNNADLFLQNRRHRMNYFTVCGELARIYLYKNDIPNSLLNAKEVIDSQKFPHTAKTDFNETDIAKKDRIFYKELITAWYINDNVDIKQDLVKLYINDNPKLMPTSDQIDDIYEKDFAGGLDWRYKQWFFKTTIGSNGTERALLQKYISNTIPVKNRHPLVAPAMRLSEMYYIAAEASFDTNPMQAVEYYNTMRISRGIEDNLTNAGSKNEFIELLIKEARKEFYGESQIFYMYKRLNHPVKISPTQNYPASDKIFVLPIPVDEGAYNNN
ncbi:RagB/SusD family nutrient uptake outer membrane protein [Mucilaginibacter gynuensis]|uniref:RagB/SusD family nutrient uptake outer membrane protein n=1 Tax=Mucilaginibacter gynuensis TaxID=1302236 RepID=A0ABP8FVJ2_9SPHI